MTNAKHTPGPWQYRATGFYQNPFKILAPRRTGAVANIPHSTIARDGEQEANAQLIAAAPDLLEALTAVTACLRGFSGHDDFGPLDDEAVNAALAAIAKAKGPNHA